MPHLQGVIVLSFYELWVKLKDLETIVTNNHNHSQKQFSILKASVDDEKTRRGITRQPMKPLSIRPLIITKRHVEPIVLQVTQETIQPKLFLTLWQSFIAWIIKTATLLSNNIHSFFSIENKSVTCTLEADHNSTRSLINKTG